MMQQQLRPVVFVAHNNTVFHYLAQQYFLWSPLGHNIDKCLFAHLLILVRALNHSGNLVLLVDHYTIHMFGQ
jgi:hypothetical protein